jgi:tRNA threonylcarbamoyladenosine biosynthesis protein TsaB
VDLVIETSRGDVCLALLSPSELIGQKIVPKGRGEMLDGLLQELLAETGQSLNEVKRVLVSVGPGSFTGLRTGIAFAQGLCFLKNRELYGVSTLATLALLGPDNQNVGVVMRAKPGLCYVGMRMAKNGAPTPPCCTLENEALVEDEKLPHFLKSADLVIHDNRSTDCVNFATKKLEIPSEIKLFDYKVFFDCEQAILVKPNYLQKSYAEQA